MHATRLVLTRISLAILVGAVVVACSGGESTTIELPPQNDSGVEGTVTLTDLGSGRTRVEITVHDAGNPDMPGHIHSGTCDAMIPQPQFALVNVMNGRSTTEIPASVDDLLGSNAVVNLHQSNEAMEVSTACAPIPDAPG